MIEELKNLLEGKDTIIKGSQYLSAKAYIEPFINRLSQYNPEFICQIKTPDQMSVTNGKPDLVYNRVHIQAIMPKTFYFKEDCQKVIGMIYGLDVKIPIAKFYVADIDQDGNIITFDDNAILLQKLESGVPLNYSGIKSLLEKADNNALMINQLKKSYIDRDKMIKLLGEWIDYTLDGSFTNDGGKVKLSTSLPVDVYKLLIKDKDSGMYIPETKQISMYDIYKAFVSLIRIDDKDIINKFEKTILVKRLLKL